VRGLATQTYRRLAVTAHDAAGRALRYARGSARGLLHHALGHDLKEVAALLGVHRSTLYRALDRHEGSAPATT